MAQALYSNFPGRFQPGVPPFQILFSATDYPQINLKFTELPVHSSVELAPVLQFGSTPRDEALLYPIIIKEMPFVKILGCVAKIALGNEELTQCYLSKGISPALLEQQNLPAWEDLIPQLAWRGKDNPFLLRFGLGMKNKNKIVFDNKQSIVQSLMAMWDELLPRWKAVTLSLEADMNTRQKGTGEMPWLDVKFFSADLANFEPFLDVDANVATDAYMSQEEQMNYKYHINLGGSGGTAWSGTLSKLAMPGVLFHHETLTRDWFYDEIKPWVHYIPVKMDLSDLREKFEWAESHPDKAKAISEAASIFFKKMNSKEYMEELYFKYFAHYLGDMVNAYQPSLDGSETVEGIIEHYAANGMALEQLSSCDHKGCFADRYEKRHYSFGSYDVSL